MRKYQRNWWRPISALEFALVSANHRPEPKWGERVSQWAERIQIMSQFESSEPLTRSPDFHDTLFAPASFHSRFTPYSFHQGQNVKNLF